MDLACGVFQPDLLPDWLSKIGPAIAAFVAVGVLIMNRWYVRRDLKAKRKVLRMMLIGHIQEALYCARELRDEFESHAPEDTSKAAHRARGGLYELPGSERLLDLQGQLLGSADHGDEIVAEFIESCRSFRRRIDDLTKFALSANDSGSLPPLHVMRLNAVMNASVALAYLGRTGEAAIEHLGRHLPRISID